MQSKRIIFCEDSANGAVLVFFLPEIQQNRRAPALLAACRQQAGYSPETQQRGSGVDAGVGQYMFRTENKNAAAQLTGSSIVFCLG